MPKSKLTMVITDEKDYANYQRLLRYLPKQKLQAMYLLVAKGLPIPLACKKLHVNIRVCRKLMQEIPSFREFIQEAEDITIAKVEHTVIKQALNGHFPSQSLILQNTTEKFAPPAQRIKAEVNGTQQVEHRGIVINVVKNPKIKKRKVIDAEVINKALPETP